MQGKGKKGTRLASLQIELSRHAAAVFPQSVHRSCLRLQGFARVPPGASTAPVYLPGWRLPSHSVIRAFSLALLFAQ